MERFNRVVDGISRLVRWIVLVQATAIFVIIIFTVISRYGFNFVFSWSEEVPRYLLIWMSFLTAAVGVDIKDHIAFDYLYNRLPQPLVAVVRFIINAGLIAFGWIMLFYGIRFVQDFGGDLMESIPFTNIWYYVVMPIAGFLIILFTVRDQLNAWFDPGYRVAQEAR